MYVRALYAATATTLIAVVAPAPGRVAGAMASEGVV
jgi:hypothetical protein